MIPAAVEFVGVCKRFGTGWALDRVDLALPEGRTTAVVGESGSGKSTLLQLMNAVYLPDEGTIRILGRAIPTEQRHIWRRGVGYAVQGAGLFPHLNVRDNVTLLARLSRRDTAFIEERYRSLTELMGLAPDLDVRFPHLLSGGEQQRVGLCRALFLQPRLLLLDEPFSALDPIARVGLYDLFVRLRDRESVSTVLVTHDIREALQLADYLVILKAGAVQQSGPVDDVRQHPANDYVKALLTDQLA